MNQTEYSADAFRRLFDLSGKTAVIAGGAGALGSAIAAGLAANGASLMLMGRTKSTLEAVAEQLGASGVKVFAVTGDCTDEKDCQRVVTKAVNIFGQVDILVNAAAAARRFPAEGFPADYFQEILATGALGTFQMCKAAGRHMIQQGRGKIINLSSVRAIKGHSLGYAANASGSGAVNALTRQLAVEWAEYDINVNCIATTEVVTPCTKDIFDDVEKSRIFTGRIPFGRVAEPSDLVGTAVYLASKGSDFLTGQVIYVDGGCTAS